MNTRDTSNVEVETDDWAFDAFLLAFLAVFLVALIPELPPFFHWFSLVIWGD
jgi:hypothetical protein